MRRVISLGSLFFTLGVNNSVEDVPEEFFSQLTSRFDKYLKRKFLKHDESARGLAIFDKSKMENQYQTQVFQKARKVIL